MFQCFSPLVCLSPIYYVYSPHGLKRQTCRGRNKKIFIMDLKTDFETYWALFKPDAQFENRMDATRIEWDACAPDKQQAIIAWLRKHGAYRGRNPYFFIQDFRVRQPKQQCYPTPPITPNMVRRWSGTDGKWQIRQDRK